MKLHNTMCSSTKESTHGVVESILKKKKTRNGTYYEVILTLLVVPSIVGYRHIEVMCMHTGTLAGQRAV